MQSYKLQSNNHTDNNDNKNDIYNDINDNDNDKTFDSYYHHCGMSLSWIIVFNNLW